MKGLIVREPWIDRILDGEKTWEIRGSNTNIRGRIYLIKSGTGKIYGECNLADSFPVDHNKAVGNTLKHCLTYSQWIDMKYKKPHAWVMAEPIRYKEPIPYNHPQGAVIWVNIDELSIPKAWVWGNEISDAVDNLYKSPTCPTCEDLTYGMSSCPFCGQALKEPEKRINCNTCIENNKPKITETCAKCVKFSEWKDVEG